VPLYDSFGVDALEFIIENVQCSVLFVDGIDKQVNTLIALFERLGEKCPIKHVIFSDNISEIKLLEAKKLNANIYTCTDLFNLGESLTDNVKDLVSDDTDLEQVSIIMYTSGSTGMPKGVCLKRLNLLGAIENAKYIVVPFLKTK